MDLNSQTSNALTTELALFLGGTKSRHTLLLYVILLHLTLTWIKHGSENRTHWSKDRTQNRRLASQGNVAQDVKMLCKCQIYKLNFSLISLSYWEFLLECKYEWLNEIGNRCLCNQKCSDWERLNSSGFWSVLSGAGMFAGCGLFWKVEFVDEINTFTWCKSSDLNILVDVLMCCFSISG